MVQKLGRWMMGGVCFLSLLISSYHWLPVHEVWFGKHNLVIGQLTTPAKWKHMIQRWDWVDRYALQWVYPGALKLSITCKEAVAKQKDNSYIASDGSVFHIKQDISVPVFDVERHQITRALRLLSQLREDCDVSEIKSYASGSVEVLFSSGDRVLLPDMQDDQLCWPVVMRAKASYPLVYCDLRHPLYASCQEA